MVRSRRGCGGERHEPGALLRGLRPDKLDAIADGLADLMEHHLDHDDVDLQRDVDDLKDAVGLQQR